MHGAAVPKDADSVITGPASPTDDRRWAAIESRDADADGSFVYGVVTTGVFCRPSCPSKRARPENVRFFDTPEEAVQSGLRACKRCDPTGPGAAARRAQLVAAACRVLDEAVDAPDLATLARQVGVSPFHLHRTFRAATGITPKAYTVARRAERLRGSLRSGLPVTESIYDAGFASVAPFYSSSNDRLGMTPSEFRHGGTDVDVLFAVGQCSLGTILVAVSARGVCAIAFGDPDDLVRDVQDQFHAARLVGDHEEFNRVMAQVIALVEDPGADASLIPLDIRGTAFQERVWQALRRIPPGRTASYAEVAASIGSPTSVRAVAGACAANQLAVAIPCHRVVRTDGTISGYRWGVERKSALLERERHHADSG